MANVDGLCHGWDIKGSLTSWLKKLNDMTANSRQCRSCCYFMSKENDQNICARTVKLHLLCWLSALVGPQLSKAVAAITGVPFVVEY